MIATIVEKAVLYVVIICKGQKRREALREQDKDCDVVGIIFVAGVWEDARVSETSQIAV